MVIANGPLHKLLSLASSRASGEFVCASSAGEVHVYLQEGRIAWATDSKHPFAFATHLQENGGIDVDTFRQVVEECRRKRLRLGETFVEWGLTTIDGVREALSLQIGYALTLLSTMEQGQDVFLGRTYRKYDDRLTFSVQDILGGFEISAAASSSTPPPFPPNVGERHDLAHQLRASVEGLAWVEVFEREQLIDGSPAGVPQARTPVELIRTTVLDGADFAAIRSQNANLVGLSVTPPRSVWCRTSPDSIFGTVVSAICTVAGGAERVAQPPTLRTEVAGWSMGAEREQTIGSIRCFMERATEVLGTLVLGGTDGDEPKVGCGSRILDLDQCIDTARRRRRSLTHDAPPFPDDEKNRALSSIGFHSKTMVSGEPELWCFGTQMTPETGESAWLFIDRRASQGLGWAYLAALTRVLCSDPGRKR